MFRVKHFSKLMCREEYIAFCKKVSITAAFVMINLFHGMYIKYRLGILAR